MQLFPITIDWNYLAIKQKATNMLHLTADKEKKKKQKEKNWCKRKIDERKIKMAVIEVLAVQFVLASINFSPDNTNVCITWNKFNSKWMKKKKKKSSFYSSKQEQFLKSLHDIKKYLLQN